ncbi:MAG: hypothetical protein RL077_336 [Verrucomicrobiota bacterium]|jgi:hypothetical protein
MNEPQFPAGRKSGSFSGPKGMTVPQARGICAQVQNWAMLASGIDNRAVPVTPDVPLKKIVYAMQTLEKANLEPGIRYSTVAALIALREGRVGASLRTRRADGTIVTLTLSAEGAR